MGSEIQRLGLDRQAARRPDAGYLAALVGAPEARFFVLAGEKLVIVSSSDRSRAALRWFSAGELARLGIDTADALFLGIEPATGAGRFAIHLPEVADANAADHLRPAVDLRSLAAQGVLAADELCLAAQAKSLVAWHASSRYCGRCGAPTRVADGGWKRVCTACAHELFPRVDPVAIMLVTDGARCVLARSGPFPDGVFSALAGFVEPGEDLAEAVRRETAEEVGIEVGDVAFVASQSWPYPHTLMLGCFAEARTTVIVPAAGEIEAARWFTRDEVAAMLDGRHPDGVRVPGREALANTLVRRWLASA